MKIIQLSLIAALASFACESTRPAPEQLNAAIESTAAPAKELRPAKLVEPKAEAGPRSKPFKETETEKLGTLPPGVGLASGQQVPALSAKDSTGQDFSLQEHLKKGPVLLMFYRGGWCPFCNFQVRLMTESYPDFKKRGVTPVMVSVDRVTEAAKTQASYDIPFPILSDPDLKWHEAFRVVNPVEEAIIVKLRKRGMDLEANSGRKHHKVAIPSAFLIDQAGGILFAHADKNYKVRPGAKGLLAAVDRAMAD